MSKNPFLDRLARQKTGAHGHASEKRVAKRVGGRQTRYSGAMEGEKGDIRVGGFLVEAKATIAGSFRVSLDWLCKIAGEAERQGKLPALAVTFTTGNGAPRPDGKWVLVKEADFVRLTHAELHEHDAEGG